MATGIYLNDDEETYTVTFPGDDILTTVTSSGATAANWIVTTRQINQDLEWHPTFQSQNIADRYFDGYCRLRSWAYNSLDSYKHELLRVLYPVFIHCFMDLVARGYMQEGILFSKLARSTCFPDIYKERLRALNELLVLVEPIDSALGLPTLAVPAPSVQDPNQDHTVQHQR